MRPPEQSKRELVQQWMDKAADDLGLAGYLLQEDSPYQEAICPNAARRLGLMLVLRSANLAQRGVRAAGSGEFGD